MRTRIKRTKAMVNHTTGIRAADGRCIYTAETAGAAR